MLSIQFRNFIFLVIILHSGAINALDIKVLDTNLNTQNLNINTQGSTPYELAREVIAPSNINGYIRHADLTGTLVLQLASRLRSKVNIDWDNKEHLFLKIGDPNDVRFDKNGSSVGLIFNALKPVHGHIRIYNQQKQLLKTVAYSIKKERHYQQSLNLRYSENQFGVSTSNGENVFINSSDKDKTASISYRIRQKTRHSADPYWSLNTNYNTDLEDQDDRSYSASISYTW